MALHKVSRLAKRFCEALSEINTHPVRHLRPAVPSRCMLPRRTTSSDVSCPPAAPGAGSWFRYFARFADADVQRARVNSDG